MGHLIGVVATFIIELLFDLFIRTWTGVFMLLAVILIIVLIIWLI